METSTVLRVKQFIDFKKISVRKFEESVGFSNGSFSSQYKGNKTIGSDKIENILRVYPEISAEWLLTGKGNMLKGEVKAVADTPPLADSVTNALIQRISEQGEEIGRLKRENEELKRQGGSGALGAAGFGNANAG